MNCTYAHRMRNTRNHAPILHILSAAGVRSIPFGPDGASRSALYPEDEEAWMEDRRRSMARIRARREKRRERPRASTQEQFCDEECQPPYESDAGSGSVSGCWGSGAREPDGDRVRDREGASEKRMRRFHVSNPDPGMHVPQHARPLDSNGMYGAHVWEGGAPDLTFPENYGRTNNEQYRLTQEVLAYSFGKS